MLSEFMWLLSAGWESVLYSQSVRMAERSKALRSGRSPILWAWVRIPLLTRNVLLASDLIHKFLLLIRR